MECSACHTELPDFAVFCHACGARQGHGEESASYEYAAFISYRHRPRDREVAIAVQRAIEGFRLPVNVVRTDGATWQPAAGALLGKCFRDSDELAISGSLPDRIAEALAASRTLVVVCSPETPQSEWVAREIELFAQLHGRARIFVVLAEGGSSESMPALLRERTEVASDGFISTKPVEPLAADLRLDSAARDRDEKLRIIAAVAGCNFDDLRQRGAARRRRRIGGIAAVIVAVSVCVFGFAWWAQSSNHAALEAESLRLAVESQRLLAQGDRYGAIEAALEALPSSGAPADRPLVPEAQQALEDALQLDLARGSIWRNVYTIVTENPLTILGRGYAHADGDLLLASSAIAIDEEEDILCISDDMGAVNTYDIATGKHLARCATPDETAKIVGGTFTRTLVALSGKLVVSHQGLPAAVSCFDSRTGELLWSLDGFMFPVMDAPLGGDYLVGVQPHRPIGFGAVWMDIVDKKSLAAVFESEELPSAGQGVEVKVGERILDIYLAAGDKLLKADLAESSIEGSVSLAYPCMTSLAHGSGIVVAATASPIPEEGFERSYALEAFDEQLNPLWSREGTFSSQMMYGQNTTAFQEGAPLIGGFTANGAQIAFAVGREAMLLDAATGEELLSHQAAQTILGAFPSGSADEEIGAMAVSCVDGTVTVRATTPGLADVNGDSTRLVLPYPIRWSATCVVDGSLVVLVAPVDGTDRIVAYRTDAFTEEEGAEESERTLDELIKIAQEVLAEAGKAAGAK